jgi:hypothetical protein
MDTFTSGLDSETVAKVMRTEGLHVHFPLPELRQLSPRNKRPTGDASARAQVSPQLPDRELHRRLLLEHNRQHVRKVTSICRSELDAILTFALRSAAQSHDPDFALSRAARRLRYEFRNGGLNRDSKSVGDVDLGLRTPLAPLHTLEVGHYLHFHSESLLADLSAVFLVRLSESRVEDPNPILGRFLSAIQDDMQPFLNDFHPFDRIRFPFVVCVVGRPSASSFKKHLMCT